jgi:cardiolipin synthase A/B
MNRYTLFTSVRDYHENLVTELATARHQISLTFLSFDSGQWADQIAAVLTERAGVGVHVRLMVDQLGQVLDEPRHFLKNIALFNHLRSRGVQVDVYHPGPPLQFNNRLHCKIAAIDDRTAYLGGSNIGDYYTAWTDTNLRVDGRPHNPIYADLLRKRC